jgi:hypothetical protein
MSFVVEERSALAHEHQTREEPKQVLTSVGLTDSLQRF